MTSSIAFASVSGADAVPQPGPFAARPALGLLGAIIGTIFAVFLVPVNEHYARGALVPSATALALGMLAGPVWSARRHPVSAFRPEHLLLLGLVYWLLLDALQSLAQLWDVTHATVQATFLYTGLFAACLWLGSALTTLLAPPVRCERQGPDVGPAFLYAAGLLCFVLGFAQALVTCRFSPECLVEALAAPRFEVPWFSGPGIKGLNQILLYMKYFGFLLPPLLAALYLAEGRLTLRSLVLTLLTAAFLLLLLRDGGRKEVGVAVGAGLLAWMLLQPRLRGRHFGYLLGAVAGLLLLMQVMVTWRDVGVTRAFGGAQPAPKAYGGLVVDFGLDWMTHAIQTVPERAPHVGWNGIAYALSYPIPRSVWPTKPPQHGIDLPRHLGRQYGPGFSWNCTAVCDLYLIGGWFAVAMGGVMYGVLANLASRLLFRPQSVRSRLLYAVIAMTLFLTLRALWEFTAQGTTVVGLLLLFASHRMWLRLRPLQR